jgi:ribosomal peptide maturation radical SAM protein 1
MCTVLLVVMPFASIERPQISVSTLKAQLLSQGVPCDIAYLNLGFAAAVGYDLYTWFTNYYNYSVFAGERAFARVLFPQLISQDDRYLRDILVGQASFSSQQIERVVRLCSLAQPFLEYCFHAVDWKRYSVIGFTSTFEQNLASLALSRRLKDSYPDKVIVFGGGNCAGHMGRQLHQSFPWVDFVFTGEADFAFPNLVRRLGRGDPNRDDIPGYVRREGGTSIATDPGAPVRDLDALPYPNYDDFFQQLALNPLAARVGLSLPIETSRGCWWGEKQHCTFCGLGRQEVVFRAKSARRALAEIEDLTRRYRIRYVGMVDNILSMKFFETVLPALKRRPSGIRLLYETKANLKRSQVALLRDAGVASIQPGIESLSDHQLRLMRKGVTALQNVQLLKWCEELGVRVHWNHLYGFPGEHGDDYAGALDMMTRLSHLPPADASGPMRLDRFSPYFEAPEAFGLRIQGPAPVYRYLYPFDASVLTNLAFFFEYDFEGKSQSLSRAVALQHAVSCWNRAYPSSRLEVVQRQPNEIVVWDNRPHRRHSLYRFGQPEKTVIEYCDAARRLDSIAKHLTERFDSCAPSLPWLRQFLDYLVDQRLMVTRDNQYLTVILSAKASRPADAW